MQNATNSARPLENEPSAFGASHRNADNGDNYVDQELTDVHGESNAPVTQERSKSSPDSAVEMGSLMKSKEDESETAPTVRQRLQNPAAWPLAGVCVSYREYIAEFWGTFIMLFMGVCVVAASKVNPTMGGYLGITIGWGMAVAIALYVSLGISGGHINPAVTFANAVWGLFPWRKVPGYFLAQFLGAFVGAACAYGIYGQQLRRILGDEPFGDNGYANVFSTYPMPGNSFWSSIWSEFACTMMLLVGVCGIFDEKNAAARGYEPIAVGLLVNGIGITMGSVTGYAINPARDFAPRAFSAILFGSVVFTKDSYYFFVPLFVPLLGGTVGVFLYLFFMPEAKKAAVKDAESK